MNTEQDSVDNMVPSDRDTFEFDSAEPRRRLIGIALLPSAATLGNLLFGFLAIMCCLLSIRSEYFQQIPVKPINPHLADYFPTYIAVGCYLIVASMICDALDGRLARIARQTSEFGAQLDSIADIVSFGAAPAMLFITLLLRLAAPNEGDPLVSKLLWRCGLLGAIVYVSCAAVRLARYNAENVKDESGQKNFTGLPVPGAAAAFVALLVVHEQFASSGLADWASYLRWTGAVVAMLLGFLMVSRFDYVHVFNRYVRREQPPIYLVWLVVAAIVGLFYVPQVTLALVAYTYVASGLIPKRRPVELEPREAEARRFEN